MTDWNAIAQARKLNVPPENAAIFAPVLEALEEAFRPLLKDLSYTESE